MSDKQALKDLRETFLSRRLERALSALGNPLHLMNTGAHPDDEHSALLAWLRFGRGVAITTLSATRGQGGQNRFGPERGALLGHLRSREMELAAQVLDCDHLWLDRGGDDRLTDFGFSKSGVDSLRRWGGAKGVIDRMVRAYRIARPDIVLPTFLDVPGQHGHHRAMTQAALAALPLAADPAYDCDGLAPWGVAKAYLPAWSGGGTTYDDELPPPPATVIVHPNGVEPWTGADWALIGEASRLCHASQDMGDPDVAPNPVWPLHLIGGAPEADVLDALPQTYGALPNAPAALAQMDGLLAQAPSLRGADLLESLLAADRLLQKAYAEAEPAFTLAQGHRLRRLKGYLDRSLLLAKGLLPQRLSAQRVRLGKGEGSAFTFTPALGGDLGLKLELNAGLSGDESARKVYGTGAQTDLLYPDYKALGGNGAGHAVLVHHWQGGTFSAKVDFDPPLLPLPDGVSPFAPAPMLHSAGQEGQWQLSLPQGYQLAAPKGISYENGKLVASKALAQGHHKIKLSAKGAPLLQAQVGHLLSGEAVVQLEPLALDVVSLDLALPHAKIAYLAGSEDLGPLLGAMGLQVDVLDDLPLAQDLARYDTLLVGVVGFARSPSLADGAAVLADWVREGGNLVTLYQRPDQGWPANGLGLADLRIGQPSLRWRVTDPCAKVDFLCPDHPLLVGPNRITARDFCDWDKERGLYFASHWGAGYQPLFALSDEGEPKLQGGLVTGRFGKGRHSHCALSLHHQMQKLRSGAFRLMANLLAPA